MADDDAGAVRRTPRPHPQAEDHQTPETGAPAAPGATNPATPVSPDAGTGTGDLRVYEVTLTPEIPITGGRLLFAGPECDMEAYAALPPCAACEGGGQDTHGTVFEAPLAVHFAGPPVRAERRLRQLCMWCGHVLIDVALTRDTEPPEWPVSALIKVEDGVATVVPHDGGELPPGCCALPDDEEPAGEQPAAPAPAPWGRCPNTPPCEHPSLIHDVSGDPEDPKPMCCADGCRCGQPDDGPDEAQETRAAADWPAEPVDTHADGDHA